MLSRAAGWAAIVIPCVLSTFWIFNRIRQFGSRNEARRGAIAFAVSAIVAMALAYPLATLIGGYVEVILGSRFILPSIAVFIVVVMVCVPGIAVSWALRPSAGVDALRKKDGDEHR